MSDDLPPLPEPYAIWETWGQNVDVFTAKQMREYAKQAVEAERVACAQIATQKLWAGEAVANAIRARSKT